VRTAEGWRDLQQYLVGEHAQAQVEEIEIEGIADARPTPEVLAAIAAAEVIVIGPSNPVISIGPIVSMPALREAISAADAPVIAVSPYVAGEVVKGPTDIFMAAIGRPSTAAGVASLYEGLIDGMVCDAEDPDPPPENVQVLTCPTLMDGGEGRFRLAARTLDFASRLRSQA
jgi:LPPG:FO 2-phospho-L-lactate transferase